MKIFRRGTKPAPGRPDNRPCWLRVQIGSRVIRRSLKTRDPRVAMERAALLVAREQRIALGIEAPIHQHLMRPLEDHLSDFMAGLAASNAGKEHLRDRRKALEDYVAHARAKRLGDLDSVAATRWLGGLRASGLSARTVNKRASALKQFGRWLLTHRRLDYNPLAALPRQDEDVDRHRERRAISFEQFHRLLRAARTRPMEEAQRQRVRTGVTPAEQRRLYALGETRALVYALAATTGLRRNELAGLQWGELDLDAGVATIPATRTKRKRKQKVLLYPGVVAMLRARRPAGFHLQGRVVDGAEFPCMRTFRRDLEAAGIPYRDESGRVADFHALRGTIVTWLQATGALPAEAKALARHARLETTMRHYTDATIFDLRGALSRLPLRLDEGAAAPDQG